MIKNYFKQAWASACHNKVSTCLYLSGVALAVTTVMIISIVFHTQLSPIYPEYNRNRMAYVSSFTWERDGNTNGQSNFPWPVIEPLFGNLENAEAVLAHEQNYQTSIFGKEGSDLEYSLTSQWVNDGFFRVFTYEFLAGSPLTAAEMASGAKVAIIDRPTAEQMFGSVEEAIGKVITYESNPLTVKGVVREASGLTPVSYANVFIPISVMDNYDQYADFGSYRIALLIKKGSDIEKLRKEIASRYDALSSTRSKADGTVYILHNQPKSHLQFTFNPYTYKGYTEQKYEKYLIFALVLLLVPALNLSGLVMGNVLGRANEIGIRKSFGASRFRLVGEVVTENFILTLAGAIIGLIISWLVIYYCRDLVFSINGNFYPSGSDNTIRSEMLYSPTVFLITLGAAFLLNTVSSFLPAWRSLSRPIVESLNQKL